MEQIETKKAQFSAAMGDQEIIQLFFQRCEEAITQTQKKYGALCRSVAQRLLTDPRDTEGCVSDTYLRAWNVIPLERPRSLRAYLARITRNLALDRYNYNSLTAEIYDYDRYELEDIQGLKEGDQIQVCRKPVTVESIRRDNGTVIINGGIENGGVELIEDDGLYRTNAMDDRPIYYDLGTITLPLSTDCTFEDHPDLVHEPDGLVYEYEDVPSAITSSEMPFNCYNTVITVRQEQVVQIIRYWIP